VRAGALCKLCERLGLLNLERVYSTHVAHAFLWC
jgi:hypothetical protein